MSFTTQHKRLGTEIKQTYTELKKALEKVQSEIFLLAAKRLSWYNHNSNTFHTDIYEICDVNL